MKILFVDGDPTALALYKVIAATTGEDLIVATETDPVVALENMRSEMPDLIVVNYTMPKMNGLEFISLIRREPCGQDIPIVMITAASDREIRHEALKRGASDLLNKPVDAPEMRARLMNMLALRRALIKEREWSHSLAEKVRLATSSFIRREQELTLRLTQAAEFRDPETGHHILRVAYYSFLIAQQLGLPKDQCDLISQAAPLHDVGKLGVPDAILLKKGPLSEAEYEVMKKHTMIGYSILRNSESNLIRTGAEIARTHHERVDGGGYPDGLKGEEIPISGRIIAVADVFDALTSERPYKAAWSLEKARDYLCDNRGTHFDPACVDAFLVVWDDVVETHKRLTQDGESSWTLEDFTTKDFTSLLGNDTKDQTQR